MLDLATDFAEDKDVAADVRERVIRPSLQDAQEVVLDFSGVELVTQSFIHAMISDVLRTHGEAALELIVFKGCDPAVRGIVETVVQYSLETVDELAEPGSGVPAEPEPD